MSNGGPYRIMFPDGSKYWVKGENFAAAIALGAREITQLEMNGGTMPYPYWTPQYISGGTGEVKPPAPGISPIVGAGGTLGVLILVVLLYFILRKR